MQINPKYQRYLLIGFLFFFLVGCKSKPIITSTPTFFPTPLPTRLSPTATSLPINREPNIVSLSANTATLCPNCQSALSVFADDPEEDSLTYLWHAEFGILQGQGSSVSYSPGRQHAEGGVDQVIVTVSDGKLQSSATISILILTEEQASHWVQTGGPTGGVFHTIEIDPSNPAILYVAGNGSNVYKSENGGDNWFALPSIGADYNQISNLILSKDDPQTLYAQSHQISKSVDGGNTWRVIDYFGSVTTLAMHPDDSLRLLAGTYDGRLLASKDGGNNWRELRGIWGQNEIFCVSFGDLDEYWVGIKATNGNLYHSEDEGRNWKLVELNQRAETYIHSIYVDHEDYRSIYIGLADAHNEMVDPAKDTLMLQSKDGGETWQKIQLQKLDTMVNLIGRPAGSSVFYLGTGGAVFRSTVDHLAWEQMTIPGRQGDVYDLAVDPRNPAILYLPRRGPGVIKSYDGGQTWTPINEGLINVSISLLAQPQGNATGTVYATANSGEGVFRTRDYGYHWENITGNGITHPWADEIRVNPLVSDEIWYVADVGEVFQSKDGGDSWRKTITPYGAGFRFGSVYAVASAPSNAGIIYALKNGFGIFKTESSGFDWSFLHQSEIDYTYSIAVHPQDADIVYSGYLPKPFQNWAMVRKTTDGGQNWETSLKLEGSKGVTSVAIDPRFPQTVYAGSIGDRGQIWVTYDAGKRWQELQPGLTFTNIHNFTTDPNNPAIAYAGVWGGGTYQTRDYGRTWSRLQNDPTSSASAIIVAPGNSKLIYLADRTAPRVYRTEDGGETWETYFDAGDQYYRILTATIAPGDPDILFTSVFKQGGPFYGDLFKLSPNQLENIGTGLPRLAVALAVDPNNISTIYAISHAGGVYKTEDGGVAWHLLSGEESGLPQSPAIGYNGLVIDPSDTQRLYLLGGSDVVTDELIPSGAKPSDMFTIYLSEDGGVNWINLDDGNLGAQSNSIKSLVIFPKNPKVLFAGGLLGVFSSQDGGATWKNISAGLNYTPTSGVALTSDGTRIYAPTLGGGVFTGRLRGDNTVAWDPTSQLSVPIHNVQVLLDPSDSDTVYASAYPGGIFKSIDGGRSWSEANFGLPSFSIDDPNRQGYYAIAAAPSDPTILYLGIYGFGVYRSTDGAITWQPVNGMNGEMRGKGVYSLVVDKTNSSIVFVSSEQGVFHTNNAGSSWKEENRGLGSTAVRTLIQTSDGKILAGTLGEEMYELLPGSDWNQLAGFGNLGTLWPLWDNRPLYQYTSLIFHPFSPDLLFFGTFPAGIYKSGDGGKTWKERNIGWTNDGVFTFAFHPVNPEILFAGTYNGINRSLDLGEHWEMWDHGWPDEQWVFSIDFDPRDPDIMYACSKNGAEMGRGVEGFRGAVMKSLDGGRNWFPIKQGLNSNQEFYKIIVDRFIPDILYLATQREGIFISRDAGQTWKTWNEGLSSLTAGTNGNNVTDTMMITPDGLHLFFGSSDRGVFRRMTEGGLATCNCLAP
jgi:photosystem II stability/assembly factor-like uncharacterized protein